MVDIASIPPSVPIALVPIILPWSSRKRPSIIKAISRTAKRMVYIAHAMGAHIIKFQIHVLDKRCCARLRSPPTSRNPLRDAG